MLVLNHDQDTPAGRHQKARKRGDDDFLFCDVASRAARQLGTTGGICLVASVQSCPSVLGLP